MRHTGLKARMAIVGTILFGFYAVAAVVVMGAFGWPLWLVLLGSVAFVGVQYKVGKWGLPLSPPQRSPGSAGSSAARSPARSSVSAPIR